MRPKRAAGKQPGQQRERDTVGHVDGAPGNKPKNSGTIGEDYFAAKRHRPAPWFFR